MKPYRNHGKLPTEPRLMKFKINDDGYNVTTLYNGDVVLKSRGVAKIVLEEFICKKPPPPYDKALHIDGNRLNDHVDNLYWGSSKENSEDSRQHGTWVHGDQVNTCVLTEENVRYVRSSKKSHAALARELEVSPGAIWHIRAGRTWKHVK